MPVSVAGASPLTHLADSAELRARLPFAVRQLPVNTNKRRCRDEERAMRRFETWRARRWAAVVGATALVLAGCWGGGGDGGGEVPAAVEISGVAAVGAALGGATIEVVDKDGNVVATKTANEDGSYTLTIAATAKPPFVASARKGDVLLFSPIAESKKGTINITPITNLLAAQLSPTGDPAALAGHIRAGRADVRARKVQDVVKALVEALRPLMLNAGAENVDPLSGAFVANGTGIDKVLNSLNIAINKTETGSNITITVKAAVTDGQQPPAINFTNTEAPPALPASVATATLPEDNIDQLVAAYVSKLQACYALPVTERVSGPGGPSAVIAPTCRETFFGNDPATFKQNGGTVSNTGSFGSLWNQGATGVTFSEARVDAINADGKILLVYKSTSTAGGVSYSRTWLKKEGTVLKSFGNQYNYQFQVRPWSETRELLNSPTFSYLSTGFDVALNNVTSAGSPIFDRVLVTSPNGRVTTFKPNTGLSFLVVVRADDTLSGTSVVRLAGRFTSGAAGTPRNLVGENSIWGRNPAGNNVDWTEEEIKAITNVGRWKADFFLAGNTGTTPDATQYAVTGSRPLTPSELTQRVWARLSDDIRNDMLTGSAGTGYLSFANGELAQLDGNNGTDGWSVPAGAIPPTFVQVFGFAATGANPAPRWNDSINVSSITRKAVISCSAQGGSDPHCATSPANTYSSIAKLNLLQMIGYDSNDMEWVTNTGTYTVTLP
jgi:hypothetical protein